MTRFGVVTFGAVIAAAAILAVLGWVSLRQWRASADLLWREQAREMARMAAEKVEMAVLKTEEESLARLQALVRDSASPSPGDGGTLRAALETWTRQAPLFDRVYLFDRGGRLLYPDAPRGDDPELVTALLAEISPAFWDRGARRHIAIGDRIVLVAAIQGPRGDPLLAALRRDEEVLRRDVLETMLGGREGASALAVVDAAERPVYAPRPLDGARRLLTVAFGEALPAWRVAVYQLDGGSPAAATRWQSSLFMAAFALLLVVIALGLGATYRLIRRESEMARLKADFVANVSHDLKTPLSLIRMFAETLELDRVADERTRREYYGVITRESERLTRLIDNVLDFSRIEHGRQRYEIAPGPVEPVVQEAVDSFRHAAAREGFTVDVDVAPDLPDVRLDPSAIKQALANLIDNAIKYSGDRRHVEVSVRRAGEEVLVEVADEGIGIPASELERIFDRFYRIGRSETQGRRGSGMGLALVKHIVAAHGGRVRVESEVGRGSRFTVHLPIAAIEGAGRRSPRGLEA